MAISTPFFYQFQPQVTPPAERPYKACNPFPFVAVLSKYFSDKKEKGFLSESIRNLRNRAGNFNAKLRLFDETARKDGPLIKSVVAYDDLVREMGTRVAARK